MFSLALLCFSRLGSHKVLSAVLCTKVAPGLVQERWVTQGQISFGSPLVCASILPLLSAMMHLAENSRS